MEILGDTCLTRRPSIPFEEDRMNQCHLDSNGRKFSVFGYHDPMSPGTKSVISCVFRRKGLDLVFWKKFLKSQSLELANEWVLGESSFVCELRVSDDLLCGGAESFGRWFKDMPL